MNTEQTTHMPLEKKEFNRVKHMLYNYSGIYLNDGKEALVRARLMKRMRKMGMVDFVEYLNYVENEKSGAEFLSLIDVLTTNKTSFFREEQHFDFLKDEVMPQMNGAYKWWSAGCSSGEEPVTLAMILLENKDFLKKFNVKILATDLSRDMLSIAKHGQYSQDKLKDLPDRYLKKYFTKSQNGEPNYQVKNYIRNIITYGRLNLQDNWPMKGPFQIIMCRNVMIYFNRETQMKLVSKFYDLLMPDGFLFLGHSESISGKDSGFVNIKPAVYQKRGG